MELKTLEQDWANIVNSEPYQLAKPKERLGAFNSFVNYHTQALEKQALEAPEDQRPALQDTLKSFEGWGSERLNRLNSKYTIGGQINQLGDDLDATRSLLSNPQALMEQGFEPEEISAARKAVFEENKDLFRAAVRAQNAAGTAFDLVTGRPQDQMQSLVEAVGSRGQPVVNDLNQGLDDAALEEKFYTEPGVADMVKSQAARTATAALSVTMRWLSGLSDLTDRFQRLNESAYDDKAWTRDSALRSFSETTGETAKAIDKAAPLDPRIGENTAAFMEGAAQMPGQIAPWLVPGVGTALGVATSAGQVYQEGLEQLNEDYLFDAYKTEEESGTLLPGQDFEKWKKTLSDTERDEIKGMAAGHAMVAALPNAAMDIFSDKLLVGKMATPGLRMFGTTIANLRRSAPTVAKSALFTAKAGVNMAVEGGTETLQGANLDLNSALVRQDFAGGRRDPSLNDPEARPLSLAGKAFSNWKYNFLAGMGGAAVVTPMTAAQVGQEQATWESARSMVEEKGPVYEEARRSLDAWKAAGLEGSAVYARYEKNLRAQQDEAHWTLWKLGDPAADQTRAEKVETRRKAGADFQTSFAQYLSTTGASYEDNRSIGSALKNRLDQIGETYTRLRESYRAGGFTQAAKALEAAERTAKERAQKDAVERQKEAQRALDKFVGSSAKPGQGRAVYGRAVVAQMFPDFAYSEDYKNDDVVVSVLDAIEGGALREGDNVQDWLNGAAQTPSSAAPSSAPVEANNLNQGVPNNGQQENQAPQGQEPRAATAVPAASRTQQGAGTGVAPGDGVGAGDGTAGATSPTPARAPVVPEPEITIKQPDGTEVRMTRTGFLQAYNSLYDEVLGLGNLTPENVGNVITGARALEQIVDEAPELTPEQKAEWKKPVEGLRGYLEGEQAKLKPGESVEVRSQEQAQDTPAAPVQGPATSLDQAIADQTPVNLGSQVGVLTRDPETGRPVFKADNGTEIELRVSEAAAEKAPEALLPTDLGTETDAITPASVGGKRFSVLPQRETAPARPVFVRNEQPQGGEPSNELQQETQSNEGQTSQAQEVSPSAVDMAAIEAAVKSVPDAHQKTDGRRKLISREAAVVLMDRINKEAAANDGKITRKRVLELGRQLSATNPQALALAELAQSPEALANAMRGDYDDTLGLYDRNAAADTETDANTDTDTDAETDTKTPSAVTPGQTANERWVNDAFSALEAAVNALPNSAKNRSIKQQMASEEGRAEIQRKLGGIYSVSLDGSLRANGVLDPVVREETLERILRGVDSQTQPGTLTRNVLGDLQSNLQETGDPFTVQTKDGKSAPYSARAVYRRELAPAIQAQNRRDRGMPDNNEGGTTEDDRKLGRGTNLDTDPERSAAKSELAQMKIDATREATEEVADELAAELGIDGTDARLALAKILQDTFPGLGVDAVSMGWRSPDVKARAKQTVLRELRGREREVVERLVTRLRGRLESVTQFAREQGLLGSEAVVQMDDVSLADILTRQLAAESELSEAQAATKEAREKNSMAPLEPLLAKIADSEILSATVARAVALTSLDGRVTTNSQELGSLTPEDMRRVLDSPYLPDSMREVLRAAMEIGKGDPLSYVTQNGPEWAKMLAGLIQEQNAKHPQGRRELFWNLGLVPKLGTAQGLWAGDERAQVSLFLDPETRAATAIHEAMHGVWDWKIRAYLKDAGTTLLNSTERAALDDLVGLKSFVEAAAQQRIAEAEARGDSPEAIARMRRDLLGGFSNNQINLQEFLNEAINHKPFQDFLAELTDPNAKDKTSVWRRVVNAILRLMRGNDVALDSALQRAFELSLDLAKDTREAGLDIRSRNSLQIEFFRDNEARLGRPMTPEEIELASRMFDMAYPKASIAATESEAMESAPDALTPAELNAYNNYLQVRESVRTELTPSNISSLFETIVNNPDGFTLDPGTGDFVSSGWAVAPSKKTEFRVPKNQFTKAMFREYVEAMRPLLEQGHKLGGWLNTSDERFYLDVVYIADNAKDAAVLARDGQQLAVFHLDTLTQYDTEPLLQTEGISNRDEARAELGRLRQFFDEQARRAGILRTGDAGGADTITYGKPVAGTGLDAFLKQTLESAATTENSYYENLTNGGTDPLTGGRTGIGKYRRGYSPSPGNERTPTRGSDFPDAVRRRNQGTHSRIETARRAINETNGGVSRQEQGQELVDLLLGRSKVPEGTVLAEAIAELRAEIPVIPAATLKGLKQIDEGMSSKVFADVKNGAIYKLVSVENGKIGGTFPRDIRVRPEDETVLVTGSRTIDLMDAIDAVIIGNKQGSAVFTEVAAVTEDGDVIFKQPYVKGLREIEMFEDGSSDISQDLRSAIEELGMEIVSEMGSPVAVGRVGTRWAIFDDLHGNNVMRNAQGRPVFVDALATRLLSPGEVELLRPYIKSEQNRGETLESAPTQQGGQVVLVPDTELPNVVPPKEYHKLNKTLDAEGNAVTDTAVLATSLTDKAAQAEGPVQGEPFLVIADGEQSEFASVAEVREFLGNFSDGAVAEVYRNGNNQVTVDFDREIPRSVERQFRQNGVLESAPTQQEPFDNSNDVKEYVRRKFVRTATALKTDLFPNIGGYTAKYVVDSSQGGHMIEYNPRELVGMTPAQVDAIMREELIHAASGLVLQRKNMDWVDFYTDLAKSMSKPQKMALKKVYVSARKDYEIGAEYFRVSVQKLLYGTITEAEMKETAMQKIIALLKEVVAYFNSRKMQPEVREVYDATVAMLRKADAKNLAKPGRMLESAARESASVVQVGFEPMTFGPDSRKVTQALARVRGEAEYAAIERALGQKTYIAWNEADTQRKAEEFLDTYGDDLQRAFIAADSAAGVPYEQIIAIKALAAKRAQEAANAARLEAEKLPAQISGVSDEAVKNKLYNKLGALRLLNEHYQGMALSFTESLMEKASAAGSELRAFRLLADIMAPASWVRHYKTAIVKTQTKRLSNDKLAQRIGTELNAARTKAANRTADRMKKALALFAKRFVPEDATPAEIEAAEKLAVELASPLPVRDAVVQAAVEDTVVQGIETLRRILSPEQQADPSFLEAWEQRLRKLAAEQINAAIESRAQGGRVDAPAPSKSEAELKAEEEARLADTWRSLADLPIAELVFNLAKEEMAQAGGPLATLLDTANFSAERSSRLRKAVRLSVHVPDEIRKTAAERRVTIEGLRDRLSRFNPELSSADMDNLLAAVEQVYNTEVNEAAQAALARIVKNSTDPRAKRVLSRKTIEDLLPLVNMGAFSTEAAYNAIADKFDLPTWDPAVAEDIERKAVALQALPEGSLARQEAAQVLQLEVAKANIKASRGKDRFQHFNQMASSLWTSLILSAPPTQIVNAGMSAVSVLMESMFDASGYYANAVRGGASHQQAAQFFVDAMRAWKFAAGKDAANVSRRAIEEAYRALTKGTQKFKSAKYEELSAFEMFKFDESVGQPGNAMMESIMSGEWMEAAKQGAKAAKGLGVGGAATILIGPLALPISVAENAVRGAVGQRNRQDALRSYMATVRMVGRMMLAADAMNSTAAAASKQIMMKRAILLEDPSLTEAQVEQQMKAVLDGGAAEAKENALLIAETEADRGDFGPKGTMEHKIAKARRVEQLIEQETYGPEVLDSARDFAGMATFNGEAYGAVGMAMMTIFGGLNRTFGIAAKPFNPFPRTVSNLLNNAINYMPIAGQLRAEGLNLSSMILDESSKYYKASPERGSAEYFAQHSRAAFGTVAMTLLAMMLKSSWDERERGGVPLFEIHANGPADINKRRQWQAAGGKPFTVRFKDIQLRYTDWPALNIVLGALGTVYDEAAFGDTDADPTDRLFNAVVSVAGVTLNRNMLGGASALFDVLSSGTPGQVKQAALNKLAGSYVGGFTKPAMTRYLETITTGTYGENRTLAGFVASQIPLMGPIRNKPSLNILGEPIEINPVDATVGRLANLQKTHPILTPLSEANLWVRPPQRYRIADPERESGSRQMNSEEFYRYTEYYGKEMSARLNEAQVSSLVALSKTDPQLAQDRLDQIATFSRNAAQQMMRLQKAKRK